MAEARDRSGVFINDSTEDSENINHEGDGRRAWRPETIRDLLTADRLPSYLESSNQELERAIELYEWNLTASAAVMQTTAMVEVVVRNALDVELVPCASGRGVHSWLDAVPSTPVDAPT